MGEPSGRAVRARHAVDASCGAEELGGIRLGRHSLSTATLDPRQRSHRGDGLQRPARPVAKADLSWTATASTFAKYKVECWQGLTLETTTDVTPRTSTTSTQTGVATGTTYTWKVYAYAHSWTSTIVTATATTPALCL